MSQNNIDSIAEGFVFHHSLNHLASWLNLNSISGPSGIRRICRCQRNHLWRWWMYWKNPNLFRRWIWQATACPTCMAAHLLGMCDEPWETSTSLTIFLPGCRGVFFYYFQLALCWLQMIFNLGPLCQYCREALAGLEDLALLDLSHNMINKVDRLGFSRLL